MEYLCNLKYALFRMSEIKCWNNDFLDLSSVSPHNLAIDNHFTIKVDSVTADNCKTIVLTLWGEANDGTRTRNPRQPESQSVFSYYKSIT